MLEITERMLRAGSIYPRTPKNSFLIRVPANIGSMRCEILFIRSSPDLRASYCLADRHLLVGAFAELRRTNISFVMYVHPSVSSLYGIMNYLGSHGKVFHDKLDVCLSVHRCMCVEK